MGLQRSRSIVAGILMGSAALAMAFGQNRCCRSAQRLAILRTMPNGSFDDQAGEREVSAIHVKRNGKAGELRLTALKGKSDAETTRELTGIVLMERMGTKQLREWEAMMPGGQSRRALIALADASVFLNLQTGELPQKAALEKAAQEKLLIQMNGYVDKTMARLPNFFATQDVTTFQAIEGMRNEVHLSVHEPMHYVGEVRTNVLYRGGKEVVENSKGELKESDKVGYRMLFSGQFGPVLNTVLADAGQSKLGWSHWETVGDAEAAVFHYSVARRKSHCTIKVVMPGNRFPSEARPGYHGEIAVDSTDGTILRLTVIADLTDDDPMSEANLMVEYGPVELGAQSYICPTRSVTLETVKQADSNGPATVNTQWVGERQSHDGGMTYNTLSETPHEVLINDVAFTHYQMLRSETKMITDDASQADEPKQ